MLHNQREFTTACQYLEHSCNLQMKFHGAESLHTATGHHLVARALSALGDYKKALNNEKSTHSIYQKHVSWIRPEIIMYFFKGLVNELYTSYSF